MNKKVMLVTNKQLRKKTTLAFIFFACFLVSCIIFWKWLHRQPDEAGTPAPLRYALTNNELIFQNIFSQNQLSKTYDKKYAVPRARVNGKVGLGDFDSSAWKLNIIRKNNDTLKLTLDDIRKLPKTEVIFDFKCIEGWSQVTHWGGVKFSDFIKYYGLQDEVNLRFTGMVTPDGDYYVGLDNKSMLHPQTLLCYEINDKPLPVNQGYPLRLIIPVKYGVKHLKRIGTIFFSNDRPKDYWYERGYDYYCGL
jgi:hypothetical protein